MEYGVCSLLHYNIAMMMMMSTYLVVNEWLSMCVCVCVCVCVCARACVCVCL